MSEYACLGLLSLLPLLIWLIRLLSLTTYIPPPTGVTTAAADALADVTCDASIGQAADIASTKHGLGLASSIRSNGKDIDSKVEVTGAGEIDGFHEGIVDFWIHCVYGVCISYIIWLIHTLYLTNVYTTLLISGSVLCTLYYLLYMSSKNNKYYVNYRIGYIVSLLSILLILLCILYIISFGLAYMLTLILTPIVYVLILYTTTST